MDKCKKHPKYKAIKPPRVDCKDCWNIFLSKERTMGIPSMRGCKKGLYCVSCSENCEGYI
jgi:hypothetical protein